MLACEHRLLNNGYELVEEVLVSAEAYRGVFKGRWALLEAGRQDPGLVDTGASDWDPKLYGEELGRKKPLLTFAQQVASLWSMTARHVELHLGVSKSRKVNNLPREACCMQAVFDDTVNVLQQFCSLDMLVTSALTAAASTPVLAHFAAARLLTLLRLEQHAAQLLSAPACLDTA